MNIIKQTAQTFSTELTAETAAFNTALEQKMAGLPPPWAVPVALVREVRARGEGIFPLDKPADQAYWQAIPNGQPARIIEAEASKPTGVYVYIHGGGWTFGAPEYSDQRNLRLSQATGLDVVSLSYRLGPEHPWPACAEDCLAGMRFALEYAQKRGNIPVFIGGESAGAHLSLVTLLRLRAASELSSIAGMVLNYGCFDLAMTPSMRQWGERVLVLSTPIVQWFVDNLLGVENRHLALTAEVSPLRADLSQMPPALIQIGMEDPLLDDSLLLAEKLRAAGSTVDLTQWAGGVHGFDLFDQPEQNLPIALEAQQRVMDWLLAYL